MALDETRRKLEELKHQEEEKRKHKKERKGRNSETGSERGNGSPKSNAIQGSIGSFTLLFTPELLNNMLEKIGLIDNLQNDVLDAQLLTSVQKQPQNFALSLDSQKFLLKLDRMCISKFRIKNVSVIKNFGKPGNNIVVQEWKLNFIPGANNLLNYLRIDINGDG